MKEIKVVIGKNFGDEGKGMTVDGLCRNCDALIVRHNGGAQAGHTVEDGAFRFVFHQLGSGSRWECPTYWSNTFLPDLLKLSEEAESFRQEALSKFGRKMQIKIYAHPDCACTTVYDVLLNSLIEQLRGNDRHGSCGMGIYEAVLRSSHESCSLYLRDFAGTDCSQIARKLLYIRQNYVYPRLDRLYKEYGKSMEKSECSEWVSLIRNDNLLMNAAQTMVQNYYKYITLSEPGPLFQNYDRIVFENAQGLLLDEDNQEYYPHLTPSHTGLYNVVELLKSLYGKEASLENGSLQDVELEAIYVTRTYVTRHGAGRLDYECKKEEINAAMTDLTNVPNPWQQELRYGKHPDVNTFFCYLEQDYKLSDSLPCKKKCSLMLTHLDETDNCLVFYDGCWGLDKFSKFIRDKKRINMMKNKWPKRK